MSRRPNNAATPTTTTTNTKSNNGAQNNNAAAASNNNTTAAASAGKKKASSSASQPGPLPEYIQVDGKQVNTGDLEVNALIDYLRQNPDSKSAKRCMVYPDCAKGKDCTFAHLKAPKLAQFIQNAAATAPNPYEDKILAAYVGVPECVAVDSKNCSIHELEPNALFNYLRSNPEKNSAKGCANFPNCAKGKDCSFAHLKAVRMNALSSTAAGARGAAGQKSKAAATASQQNDGDEGAGRALLAYDGLPSHVLVDGHHMSIHELEPNNLFNYFLQHPDSPTAKHCQAFPFCARGKDCSFAHLKAVKIRAILAAQDRTTGKGAVAASKADEREYKGLPATILVDGVVINIRDLEPSNLFTYLRENPESQAARRCSYFPNCPKNKDCSFAHVKFSRVDPTSSFVNAKPSASDYNGLPETIFIDGKKFSSTDLEPTLLFDFVRLHPDADNIKRCRNFPYCRSGRSCGYAHLKADRAAAISGMPAFLTIDDERVDVLKALHPTAMFNYARKHPESTTVKWCKHWPNCQDGDACTYAHKKQ
jgi:hypothetical protein